MALRDIGPGSVLRGRYLIEKTIGVGGTSTVFSALDRHRSSARANGHVSEQGSRLNGFGRIAVKVLRTETGASDARVFRMEREFRQMQRLTHTGIVRVFDLDCEDNLWFITMELLEGQPLHRYLRSGLKDTEALRILTLCGEALAYAHDQGIVHGDLKPSNVFITHDGNVRLFDFGSAPDLTEATTEPTAAHRFAATPPYASAETLEGKGVDERDEVFSLGCLAYELLSGGQHPFERKSSLDARQQGMRPPQVDRIRPRHFTVIAKALSWDRAERPAGAREFLQMLLAPEPHREAIAGTARTLERPSENVSPPPVVPAKASEVSDAPPTVEVRARTPAAPTSPVENAPTDPLARKSTATPEPLAYTEVSVDWVPPLGVDNKLASKPVAESAPEPAANAEPMPLTDLDDPPAKKFAGFVPPEMISRPKRNAEPPRATDLHVSGLSQTSPWVKRTVLIALLAVALLAGFFVLGRQLPTETSVSVVPPVVADAEASNAEPELAPVPPAPAEEVTPVAAPPRPAPTPAVIRSAPGEVSFESATVNVSAAQSMAVVNIARLKSTRGAVPIKWSTVGDTAQAGVHYESVDSKVTRFNDGQSVRSLFIQLKNNPTETSRPARSFVVKLEKAAGGPALGAITQARVIVEGIE